MGYDPLYGIMPASAPIAIGGYPLDQYQSDAASLQNAMSQLSRAGIGRDIGQGFVPPPIITGGGSTNAPMPSVAGGAVPLAPTPAGQPMQLGQRYPAPAPQKRGKGGSAPSPTALERRRRMAEAFLQQGMDTSPIVSPWQGAARLADALVGGLSMRRADQQEQAARDAANAQFMQAIQGGQMTNEALGALVSDPWSTSGQQQLAANIWEQQNPAPTEFDRMYNQYVQDAHAAGRPGGRIVSKSEYFQALKGFNPDVASGGMFQGQSTEAQGLNYLIEQGILTKQQAAEVAAGKTVTDPQSGAQFFFTPQGLVAQPPGQPPQPVGNAPAAGQSTSQNIPSGAHQITGPRQLTESQIKGNSIYAGAAPSYDVAIKYFDSLGQTSGQVGSKLGTAGNFMMTPEYQIASDAVHNILQNYVYALSGQQAPEQEVTRNLKLVMPEIGDSKERIAYKKERLNSFMNTIRVRANLEAQGIAKPGEPLPAEWAPQDQPQSGSPDSGQPPTGWTADEWNQLTPAEKAQYHQ